MALDVAILTCAASTVLDVLVPAAPWDDTAAEDAAWFTTWPTGRTENRDAFVNGRVVTGPLPDGKRAFFVQCDADVMSSMMSIATTSWAGIAALRADNSAEAEAVKAAWLGPELEIDGRIAGYLDVNGEQLV